LNCFVILIHFEFAFQAQSILEARDLVASSSLKELTKLSVLMLLVACETYESRFLFTVFCNGKFEQINVFFSITNHDSQ